MSETLSRNRRKVSQVLLVLALVDGAGAAAAGVAGELAWLDVALFALLFAVPALVVGVALRSNNHTALAAARAVALLVAALYCAVLLGNWSGYDRRQAILLPLLVAPAVVAYLAAAWAAATEGPSWHRRRHGPHASM